MSVQSAQISVGTSATRLDADEVNSVHDGTSLSVRVADGAWTVFVGPADVTTGTGFPLNGGDVADFDLLPGESLYAVTATGSVLVSVLRLGV